MGDIELVYWDNHHCTISRARSSSNWAISARNVYRLKGSGSSSYQTLLAQAAGEGASTAQASEAPTEVWFQVYLHIDQDIKLLPVEPGIIKLNLSLRPYQIVLHRDDTRKENIVIEKLDT